MSARLSIDGRACAVRAGMDLLSACLGEGIDVPYFCWHGALGSAGVVAGAVVVGLDVVGREIAYFRNPGRRYLSMPLR